MSPDHPDAMVIRVNDLVFEPGRAEILAHLRDDECSDGASWEVVVVSEWRQFPLDEEDDGEPWTDRVNFFWESLPIRIGDWTALAGQVLDYDLNDEAYGDSASPMLYVASYLPLLESRLCLGTRRGAAFALDWRGRAEANISPSFGRNMPFEIGGTIPFTGIDVDVDSTAVDQAEPLARATLRKHGMRDDNLDFAAAAPLPAFPQTLRARFVPMPD